MSGPFSTVFNDRHFSCENCDGCVSGGFDAATSQVGAGHSPLSKDSNFFYCFVARIKSTNTNTRVNHENKINEKCFVVLELVHFSMIRLLMLKNTNPKSLNALSGVCCVSEK